MDRILRIGADTVTAEAGALYIDVAKELAKHNLQFYVNIELGNLTIGSAQLRRDEGRLDARRVRPGQLVRGGMKIVTPAGELVEITEDDPELLQAARSSYGLFGIVDEVTFRVRPLQAMEVQHKATRSRSSSAAAEPVGRGPVDDDVHLPVPRPRHGRVPPVRRDDDGGRTRPASEHAAWRLRNMMWKTIAAGSTGRSSGTCRPASCATSPSTTSTASNQPAGARACATATPPARPDDPLPGEGREVEVHVQHLGVPGGPVRARSLREYFGFAQAYYRDKRLPPEHVATSATGSQADQSSLFSYSYDGNVMTIDPVWHRRRRAGSSSSTPTTSSAREHDGMPLFNQTRGI